MLLELFLLLLFSRQFSIGEASVWSWAALVSTVGWCWGSDGVFFPHKFNNKDEREAMGGLTCADVYLRNKKNLKARRCTCDWCVVNQISFIIHTNQLLKFMTIVLVCRCLFCELLFWDTKGESLSFWWHFVWKQCPLDFLNLWPAEDKSWLINQALVSPFSSFWVYTAGPSPAVT